MTNKLDKYAYTGSDLGADWNSDKTDFRVWAPTADKLEVLIYHNGDISIEEIPAVYEMIKTEQGCWSLELRENLLNRFYTYRVTIDSSVAETIDPYARACGINGIRGQIIDLSKTNPPEFLSDNYHFEGSQTDAVIYELHVRDLSTHNSSGIKNVGKYKGLAEKDTKSPEGEFTGLSHIKELGVTHVQLLPIPDQKSIDEKNSENVFNWGYDPLNYNIPEGSYSSNAYDGNVRIMEFKEAVQAYHKEGIGVVLDVVYNHTANSADSSFNKLVPGYYYRMTPSGGFYNGSACGNETASERKMMRKFIIDSVTYWVKEYHIDGFRFDLMGLHDLETMNEVRAALDEINPHILTYGEGWFAGSAALTHSKLAIKKNAKQLNKHFGVFNDDMRDGIKGSVNNNKFSGYINGNPKKLIDIKHGITAATEHEGVGLPESRSQLEFWAAEPTQTVNYTSCHDNYTLWDRLKLSHPSASEAELVTMNKLSAVIVLTSQGIPFFQAGEELGRSKQGVENSFVSPDYINQINWTDKSKRRALFDYYKGLISLRRKFPEFRLQTNAQIRQCIRFEENLPGSMIAYYLNGNENKFMVVLNPDKGEYSIPLPEGSWSVLVNKDKAGTQTLSTEKKILQIQAQSAAVLLFN